MKPLIDWIAHYRAFWTEHVDRLQGLLEKDGQMTPVERSTRSQTFNKWVRQFHRWVSLAFTVAMIANIVAMSVGQGQPPPWVIYSPLLPLALLLLTGLYLFVLPYATRWRTGLRAEQIRT
jgi:hypothetical protein